MSTSTFLSSSALVTLALSLLYLTILYRGWKRYALSLEGLCESILDTDAGYIKKTLESGDTLQQADLANTLLAVRRIVGLYRPRKRGWNLNN